MSGVFTFVAPPPAEKVNEENKDGEEGEDGGEGGDPTVSIKCMQTIVCEFCYFGAFLPMGTGPRGIDIVFSFHSLVFGLKE